MDTNVLVFKTAADSVMYQLFERIKKEENIICLIQSDALEIYQSRYPNIQFIDIEKEGFYNVTPNILEKVGNMKFDKIILVSSGARFHDFQNILDIVEKLDYETLIFYNNSGEMRELKKKKVNDWFYRILISIFESLYTLKAGRKN